MSVTATWVLGWPAPKILKGAHKGGIPQKWMIKVVMEGGNMRDSMVLRPKEKVTLNQIDHIVFDAVKSFEKEAGGLSFLTWTAISR